MTEDEKLRKIAMLRDMMTWPSKQHITDILQRRIYALQNDIEYGAPFPAMDEVLYKLSKLSVITTYPRCDDLRTFNQGWTP